MTILARDDIDPLLAAGRIGFTLDHPSLAPQARDDGRLHMAHSEPVLVHNFEATR